MTATNIYFSTNSPGQGKAYDTAVANTTGGTSGKLNQGYCIGVTSPRAADFFELRVMLFSTGTTKTNVTKQQIELFLVECHRWLNDQTSGLDYVIQTGVTATDIGTTGSIP